MSQLSIQERVKLIESIADGGGDLVGNQELAALLESGKKLYTYDGFEPSGQMHISQGIMRAINVNKMIQAGFTFRMWVADWFGYLNNKMGGDLEKIKTVGKYFIEIWRASGMDLDNTEFLWTSEAIKDVKYWETVMKVAKTITLKRAIRTTQIMGRNESDDLSAGMVFYPCMQVTDIFHVMEARVTQLGLDQQKANILAREVGEELGYWKPIIVSHGMLQGLQPPVEKKKTVLVVSELATNEVVYKGEKISLKLDQLLPTIVSFVNQSGETLRTVVLEQGVIEKYFDVELSIKEDGALEVLENTPERMLSMKMSKSMPESSIFMTDTPELVAQKIRKAYCPEGISDENPILAYCKYIIFNAHYLKRETPLLTDGKFVVSRPEKFGGDVVYASYEELEADYVAKNLYPLDLKNAVVGYLNDLLEPVRKHFENDSEAKEILEKVQTYQATR
jgi:tyrosyl-tRNA synthetase